PFQVYRENTGGRQTSRKQNRRHKRWIVLRKLLAAMRQRIKALHIDTPKRLRAPLSSRNVPCIIQRRAGKCDKQTCCPYMHILYVQILLLLLCEHLSIRWQRQRTPSAPTNEAP
ncbi:unnamed protein product, partial [Ectocarpus sp. 12 AP-2014]